MSRPCQQGCSGCPSSQKEDPQVLQEKFAVKLTSPEQIVVALAGNPNVGKSTVFNALTGLNQHTGNWPGKTVTNAQGLTRHKNREFILVDLPGTYSLLANSVDEQVARDFLCFGNPQATIVVVDATCLERNLNLVFQVLEITSKVVVCVNLLDEAKRKGLEVNIKTLSQELGVPVVPTVARDGQGLKELMNAVHDVALGIIKTNPQKMTYDQDIEEAIQTIEPKLNNILQGLLDSRWVALRLLDGDHTILQSIYEHLKVDAAHSLERRVTYCHD